jgi:hypothetical protein
LVLASGVVGSRAGILAGVVEGEGAAVELRVLRLQAVVEVVIPVPFFSYLLAPSIEARQRRSARSSRGAVPAPTVGLLTVLPALPEAAEAAVVVVSI